MKTQLTNLALGLCLGLGFLALGSGVLGLGVIAIAIARAVAELVR